MMGQWRVVTDEQRARKRERERQRRLMKLCVLSEEQKARKREYERQRRAMRSMMRGPGPDSGSAPGDTATDNPDAMVVPVGPAVAVLTSVGEQ